MVRKSRILTPCVRIKFYRAVLTRKGNHARAVDSDSIIGRQLETILGDVRDALDYYRAVQDDLMRVKANINALDTSLQRLYLLKTNIGINNDTTPVRRQFLWE